MLLWLYRVLLRLYPVRFREDFAALMEAEFLEEYKSAGTSRGQRVRLLLGALADVVTTLPAELFREFRQDLGYALRLNRQRLGTTLLAVAALAIATGASTAVFSVLNGLLLRELPFADPDRLVELRGGANGWKPDRGGFFQWVQQSRNAIESAALFTVSEMNLVHEQEARRVKVAETSANFFSVLGARLRGGRGFSSDEDIPAPGMPHPAVISHALWQQEFGGDGGVLGRTVRINGRPLTIIGIAGPRFDFPAGAALWTSSAFSFQLVPKEGAFFFQTVARLQPGVSVIVARQMLHAENLEDLRNRLAGPIRDSVWLLSGAVLFVLLAACANIAQLLVSRTLDREREFQTRQALGASPARLAQQLVHEALFLAALGSGLGILVAFWATRLAASVVPPETVAQHYELVDWRVLGFATAITFAVSLCFGLIPAWALRSRRVDARQKIRTGLLALQAALTVCLLAGSWTMSGSLFRLLRADLGFEKDRVLSLTVSLQGHPAAASSARRSAYYADALARLRQVPGVEAAGGVRFLPLAKHVYMFSGFRLHSGAEIKAVIINSALPGYFRSMRAPILAGREFEDREPEPVVLVNRAFAEQAGLAPAMLPGRKLVSPHAQDSPYTIAGVVESLSLTGAAYPAPPQIYFPVHEEPPPGLTFTVLARGDSVEADLLLPALRSALQNVEPGVPVYEAGSLRQRLHGVLAQPRFYTAAILTLAVLALLLALAGTYGAASYAVASRTKEIGVRIALGSTAVGVRNLFVTSSLRPVALGAASGIAGALALGPMLAHWIPNVDPVDTRACVAAAAVLVSAAVAAAWIATSRVTRNDPMAALRADW